jgi:hypothetical protein
VVALRRPPTVSAPPRRAPGGIRDDSDRRRYLADVLAYVEGIPLLLDAGRPDQVALELERIRSQVRAVIMSLGDGSPPARVNGSRRPAPALAGSVCDD